MEHLESSQLDNLLSVGQNMLVMFYADWCPFCVKFKPVFEQTYMDLNEKSSLKIYGCKLNEDENPLWERFSINAVPTIIAFHKGKIVRRRDANIGIGLKKSDLDSLLKELK